jgi:hypothetical protein
MSSVLKKAVLLKEFFLVNTYFASALLVACLGIIVLACMSLIQSYEQIQKKAEITSQNLCAVLSDNLIASYEKIDIAVLGVKSAAEDQLLNGDIDGSFIETFIRRRMEWIPELFALRTVTAEGIISHGNNIPPGSRISVSDRDYFIRLKSDKSAGLIFSKPLIGKISGTWTIILARRINARDGSFAGVAYGAVELSTMRAYFESLAIGKDGIVTLRYPDLSILVRTGSMKDVIGQSAVSKEFAALVQAGSTSGTFSAVSQVDKIKRIYTFRKLQPYGQYLYVGLSSRDVFAPWRREICRTIGFAALLIVLIAASTWIAYRSWCRQRQAESERELIIVKLEKSLEEVKVLSGLIPICSSCKKVRDDNGYWSQIESYISSRSTAQFSHSICPDCAKRIYPELFERKDKKKK